MAEVYLGLGSNIRPKENLSIAVRELRSLFGEVTLSNVYRNKALGFIGDDFLNLVARIETPLSPLELVELLDSVHDLAGRERGAARRVSRALDIDILLYDDLVLEQGPVRVPRDDILRYSFVLLPLAEIAPNLVHPATGHSIISHRQQFDDACHPLFREDVVL
jgi:2-amino-4-hydroxy-6-hydroxymethyldihydropteridine diphosphokinase